MPAKVPTGTKHSYTEKGSKQNGGRPIRVTEVKTAHGWKRTTTNEARAKYEAKHGKLDRNTDVDHKDNHGREGHDTLSNLQAMSHGKNVGKENKRRAGK